MSDCISPAIRCNNCGKEFFSEEELALFPDGHEFFKGCSTCKTDSFLIDLITKEEYNE